ncbi:MAG: ribosome recycling factor [Dehalococcoidia bacterium]|nr:ribosome recycling factor [Dehalococcoidia bacterium]
MAGVNLVLTDAEGKMLKAVDALIRDLTTIRTGRANPALVEHVLVEYFGTPTPLKQIASITAPSAGMLVIQPWDKTALLAIEKAVLRSELGLTPTSDGTVVRLMLPPLTEERRHELAKRVSKRLEDARVSVRNIRRDAMETLRDKEKDKEFSQDDGRRGQEQAQRLTDAFIAKMDSLGKAKEKEVLEG